MDKTEHLLRLQGRELWSQQAMLQDRTKRAEIAAMKPRKILGIGDIHEPYHDTKAIEWACDKGGDCDTVVLMGDTANLDSVSRFTKTSNVPIDYEYNVLVDLFDFFSKNFRRVVVLRANHENRLPNLIRSLLPPPVVEVMQRMGHIDLISFLALQYKNVYAVNEWCRLGDIYFSHKEVFSTIAMRSVSIVDDYFQLHYEDVRPAVVAHAHTHHFGFIPHKERMLIETGTMCHYMDYALSGRPGPSAKEVWHQGCFTAELDRKQRVKDCQPHYRGICGRA